METARNFNFGDNLNFDFGDNVNRVLDSLPLIMHLLTNSTLCVLNNICNNADVGQACTEWCAEISLLSAYSLLSA